MIKYFSDIQFLLHFNGAYMQDSKIDQKKPWILKIAMLFVILSVVMRLVAGNYTLTLFDIGTSFYWHIAFLLTLVTQALLILFFHTTKRYEVTPFVLLSLIATILGGFVFLTDITQSISVVLLRRTLESLSTLEYALKLYVIKPFIYQLPLIVLATAFLVKMHYAFMRNISIIVLAVSVNVAFIEIVKNATGYLSFHNVLWDVNNDYVFYVSLFLFVLGLLIDYNRPKEEAKKPLDENYVYPYKENKTIMGYFSFSGRVSRAEYWAFIILGGIVCGGFLTIAIAIQSVATYLIVFAVFAYVSLCMNTKRLHDIGLSGWYQLIGLIPIVGQILLLWRYVTPSQPFDNIYGSKIGD